MQWTWGGHGVDMGWTWGGHGVDMGWTWGGYVKNLNMITQNLIVVFKLMTPFHNLHKMVHFLCNRIFC
jgi:hypothetical protein